MSSGHGQTAVMWSHSNYYSMYPIETQVRQSIGMKRWGDNNFPSLDTKLLAIDSSWESERKLSLRTWSVLRWPYSSGKLHIQDYMCTTDWTGKKRENADKVGWVGNIGRNPRQPGGADIIKTHSWNSQTT